MFGVDSFILPDPAPSVALSDISPASLRALALLVRNREKPAVKTGFLNIYGAIDMIEGLEHHHSNFINITNELMETPVLSDRPKPLEKRLRHEVVAYLNRMGQFCYFAKSPFVVERISDTSDLIPSILRFVVFRDKHGAHRSIDAPRKEDTVHHQQLQAWGLSSVSGFMFVPKQEPKGIEAMLDSKAKWGQHYLAMQMVGRTENDFINFTLEQHHPQISSEAYSVVEKLIMESNH